MLQSDHSLIRRTEVPSSLRWSLQVFNQYRSGRFQACNPRYRPAAVLWPKPVHRNFQSMPTENAQWRVINNKFTRPTPPTRRHTLKLPASTYGAGTRWSSSRAASPRAMDKPLARTPLRRGRRAPYVSQDAEFSTNADGGTMSTSKFTSRIHH